MLSALLCTWPFLTLQGSAPGVSPSLEVPHYLVRPSISSGSPVSFHRGVGAMEIVAMDMKVSGMYIARQLSFNGVTFRIEEIPLDPAFECVYNRAALLVSQLSGVSDFVDTTAFPLDLQPCLL